MLNNDQSNLAKGGIAVASPPMHSSFAFAKLRTDGLAAVYNCIFWLGVRPPNLPFLWGQGPHLGSGTPSNTVCHWTPQLYLPCHMASTKSVERMWQTTDRQTTLRRNAWSF